MDAEERLFISINIPDACRASLAELQRRCHGITWTREEQLHLTMRFLGFVEASLAERIEEALSKVSVEPFLLPLGGVGFFPPRGPARVLWAGVGNGHPRLHQLRQKVDDAALAAGWRGEMRSFDPHITLGRVRDAERHEIQHWLERHRDFEGPSFRVGSFDLMSSDLLQSGAVHTLRRRFALGNRP